MTMSSRSPDPDPAKRNRRPAVGAMKTVGHDHGVRAALGRNGGRQEPPAIDHIDTAHPAFGFDQPDRHTAVMQATFRQGRIAGFKSTARDINKYEYG